MPAVQVILPYAMPSGTSNLTRPKHRFIISNGVTRYEFPYGPLELSYGAAAPTYTTVNRPGRAPLLIRTGTSLPTLTFSLTLAHLSPQVSVQTYINNLKVLANTENHLTVQYGQLEAGLWRITELTFSVTARTITNEPSRATADVTLTRVQDAAAFRGPVTGGHQTTTTTKKKTTPTNRNAWPKHYTIQGGDTLYSISVRFYSNGTRAYVIADANHIKDMNLSKTHYGPGSEVISDWVGKHITIPRLTHAQGG